MVRRALLVLDGGGTITAVSGGAPPAWRGKSYDATGAVGATLLPLVPKLLKAARMGEGVARGIVEISVDDDPIQLDVIVLLAVTMSRHRVDARSLIERAIAPFQGQAEERDVALSVEVGEVETAVEVDASKVVWVVATLIGNALRFTPSGSRKPQGGAIGIRLSTVYRADESFAVIEVEDDGPGIDEWRLRRLFKPSDLTPATGLALCMARDVALAHGGDLEVESSTGDAHFTRVRLMLPLA